MKSAPDKGADAHATGGHGNDAFVLFTREFIDWSSELKGGFSGSPAFEDFLEDMDNSSPRAKQAPPTQVTDEIATCGCQACKIMTALGGVSDNDGVLPWNYLGTTFDVCEDMLTDMSAVRKDLANCQCGQCLILRSPAKEAEQLDNEDKPND